MLIAGGLHSHSPPLMVRPHCPPAVGPSRVRAGMRGAGSRDPMCRPPVMGRIAFGALSRRRTGSDEARHTKNVRTRSCHTGKLSPSSHPFALVQTKQCQADEQQRRLPKRPSGAASSTTSPAAKNTRARTGRSSSGASARSGCKSRSRPRYGVRPCPPRPHFKDQSRRSLDPGAPVAYQLRDPQVKYAANITCTDHHAAVQVWDPPATCPSSQPNRPRDVPHDDCYSRGLPPARASRCRR